MQPTSSSLDGPRITPRTRVLRHVERMIEAGQLRGGDELPSERTIATSLGVTRKTVRAALEELQSQGAIVRQGPRSRRVADGGSPRSLMARTVAYVHEWPTPLDEKQYAHPGWDGFIYLEAARTLQAASLNVLTIPPTLLEEQLLIRERPYGVMLSQGMADTIGGFALLQAAKKAGVPTVAYSHSPDLSAFDTVASDHAQGSYLLTKHLLSTGKKRILRLWHTRALRRWITLRDTGYERAIHEMGALLMPPLSVPDCAPRMADDPELPHRFRDVASLLAGFLVPLFHGPNPPDALMVLSDDGVPTTNEALKLLGITPGKQIPVVGYDNSFAHVVERRFDSVGPAATVEKNNGEIGRRMGQLLLDRATGSLPAAPQHIIVPPVLRVLAAK